MGAADELDNEVGVKGTSVRGDDKVEVVTPPAGYGHQLKLDVVVERTGPTPETS